MRDKHLEEVRKIVSKKMPRRPKAIVELYDAGAISKPTAVAKRFSKTIGELFRAGYLKWDYKQGKCMVYLTGLGVAVAIGAKKIWES